MRSVSEEEVAAISTLRPGTAERAGLSRSGLYRAAREGRLERVAASLPVYRKTAGSAAVRPPRPVSPRIDRLPGPRVGRPLLSW